MYEAEINYCPLVLKFSNAKSLKNVEALQKRALCFLYGKFSSPSENTLKKSVKVSMEHCVKSVRMRSYFGPHFPAFGLNKKIRSISPYSVRMRKNAYQNNSEYGHFLRSGGK